MAQGIGIEEIIDIQTEAQSGGTVRAEFGTGLILTTTSDALPAGGSRKCQRFGSLSDVNDVFGDNAVARDAAVWFGADPAPRALYIGRWAATAVNTYLQGGRVTESVSDLQSITNGTYRLNGANVGTAVNLSSANSYDAIATALQTSIRTITGIPATASVAWNSTADRFDVTFATTDDVGAFETQPHTGPGSAPPDIATRLRLKVVSNSPSTTATYFLGKDAETVGQAVAACAELAVAGPPTALMLASDAPSVFGTGDTNTYTAMETTAQGGDFMTCRLDGTAGALEADDDSSALWATFNASRSHVIPVYSRSNTIGDETQAPRPDIGILAKLSSQNFDLPQSIITLVPKPLENVGTTDVNSTQLAALASKQASVLTLVGGLPSLLGGWTGKSGVWADAQWWLLWLKNEMERSIFEAMRSSKRLSVAQLRDTITGVMAKAVNSGGAKPGGVVSPAIKHDIRATTGNFAFNGVMVNGYVLWIDPPQQQTAVDRASRIARFKVWVAPSEAIHSVSGGIILSG